MADPFGTNGNGRPPFHQYQNDPFDSTRRLDPARNFPSMPPNLGRPIVPHVITFQGLISTIAKTYRNPDEAIKHSQQNARFMRQDIGVMECLESRMRSTALLDWHIEVDGPELPYHRALQERITKVLRAMPRFTQYRYVLLEALWHGRYAVQNAFGWKITPEGRDIIIKEWLPINGDKLVFRMDDGSDDHPREQIGVRVGSQFKANDLIGQRVIVPTEYGLATFLAPYERDMLVVHRHLIEDAAYEDPLDSGAIHGIGIRSRIYWEWFQKQEMLSLFMEYLERAALGFEIWYYPEGNQQAYEDMKKAAENRNGRKTLLMFPKPIGDDQMAYGVEHIEPNPSGAESFKDVLQNYFGHRIKRYILGQILTSEVEGTGLGSGVADLHLQTMLDIIKFDATNLEETITRQLVMPLVRWNDPSATNVDVRFVIQTQTPDVEKKLAAYEAAWNMGAKLKAADVMDAIGASIPEADEPFLQNPALAAQQMQNDMMAAQAQAQAMGFTPPMIADSQGLQTAPPGAEAPGQEPPGDQDQGAAEAQAGPPQYEYAAPGASAGEAEIGAGVGHQQNIRQQLVQGLMAHGLISRNARTGEIERYAIGGEPMPTAKVPSGNLLSHPTVDWHTAARKGAESEALASHQAALAAQTATAVRQPEPEMPAATPAPAPAPAPKRYPTAAARQVDTGKKVFKKIVGPAGQLVPDVNGIREHLAKHQPEPIQPDRNHPDWNEKAYNKAIRNMAAEAHWTLTQHAPQAAHWYHQGIKNSTNIVKDYLPEASHEDYPAHQHIFTAFIGALSPQSPVPVNFHQAAHGYAHMMDNHDGTSAPQFPHTNPASGKKWGVNTDAVHLLNHIIKEHWDANAHLAHDPTERREQAFEQTVNWLHGLHDPKELWEMRRRAHYTDPESGPQPVFGKKMTPEQRAAATRWADFSPSEVAAPLRGKKYGPSTAIRGFRVMGPKAGQFFYDLSGGDSGSTIDTHAVRNIARHFGLMNDPSRWQSDRIDEETGAKTPGTPLPSAPVAGENKIFQRIYQDVADYYNKHHLGGVGSPKMLAKVIQAANWVFERSLYASHGYEKADQPGYLEEGAQSLDRSKYQRRRPGGVLPRVRSAAQAANGRGAQPTR